MAKFLKNQLGLTMVEIMVAVGLLGGIAVFVMNLGQQGVKVNKQTTSEQEITLWQKEIASFLGDADACTYTLIGSGSFSGPIPTTNTSLTNIRKKTCTITDPQTYDLNTCTPITIQLGQPSASRQGVTINSFTFTGYDAALNSARIEVGYSYVLSVGQTMNKTRFLNLEVLKDSAGDFSRCVARSSAEAIDPLAVCNIALGFPKDAVAGTNPGENPYFIDGICQYKFASRNEACKAEGGLLIKPTRKTGVDGTNYGFHDDYTTACAASDIPASLSDDSDICYCRTKWKRKISLLSKQVLHDVPIGRHMNVGAAFEIPADIFPDNVGPNKTTYPSNSSKRRTNVKLHGSVRLQYKVPLQKLEIGLAFNQVPLAKEYGIWSLYPDGNYLWEDPRYIPSTQLQVGFLCRGELSGVNFTPCPQCVQFSEIAEATTEQWVPSGSISNSFTYVNRPNSNQPGSKRVFASPFKHEDASGVNANYSTDFSSGVIQSRGLSGNVEWIGQYTIHTELDVHLGPTDMCYLFVKPEALYFPDPGSINYKQFSSIPADPAWSSAPSNGMHGYLFQSTPASIDLNNPATFTDLATIQNTSPNRRVTLKFVSGDVTIEADSNRGHGAPTF
jgi:type II secretory pathway pseudopilin PulG